MDRIEDLKDELIDRGGDAQAVIERGKEMASEALEKLEGFIRTRPGTALCAALGLGFLIGRIVRR